jgi:hypothetical protein
MRTLMAFEIDGKLFKDKEEALEYFMEKEIKRMTINMTVNEIFTKLAKDKVFRSKFVRILEAEGTICD